jgi:hypothetical protein
MKITLLAFIILLSIGSVSVKAQDSSLIADETNLTYTKTGAKIVSYSELAFQAISLKWGDQFKSINIKYKTDRYGRYKEYSIYLSTELANKIKEWSKTNL